MQDAKVCVCINPPHSNQRLRVLPWNWRDVLQRLGKAVVRGISSTPQDARTRVTHAHAHIH